MGLFKRLFGAAGGDPDSEMFTDQISPRGFRDLLNSSMTHRSELLAFQEASHRILPEDQKYVLNLMGEFRDNSVGIVHGLGGGHAFIRVSMLQEIVQHRSRNIPDYATLVSLFRERGYIVKRITYISFEPVARP